MSMLTGILAMQPIETHGVSSLDSWLLLTGILAMQPIETFLEKIP